MSDVVASYRRLDEPPRLAVFTIGQWLVFWTLTGLVYGVTRLVDVNTHVEIAMFTTFVGIPALLMFYGESSRPSLLRMLNDLLTWYAAPKHYRSGCRTVTPLTIRTASTAPSSWLSVRHQRLRTGRRLRRGTHTGPTKDSGGRSRRR